MGWLPRLPRIVLFAAIVLGLSSLPALRTSRTPGSALVPAIAWAGGSPDETLNPPPVPPPEDKPGQKASSFQPVGLAATSLDGSGRLRALVTAFGRLKGADRAEFLYRVYLASMLRF